MFELLDLRGTIRLVIDSRLVIRINCQDGLYLFKQLLPSSPRPSFFAALDELLQFVHLRGSFFLLVSLQISDKTPARRSLLPFVQVLVGGCS